MQTDISEIVDYGTSYMTICCVFSVGLFGQFAFERLLQSTGKTFYTMITQLIGAIINIILDPIMIFGYFGFPEMGVAGAALATVTGQIAVSYTHLSKARGEGRGLAIAGLVLSLIPLLLVITGVVGILGCSGML